MEVVILDFKMKLLIKFIKVDKLKKKFFMIMDIVIVVKDH